MAIADNATVALRSSAAGGTTAFPSELLSTYGGRTAFSYTGTTFAGVAVGHAVGTTGNNAASPAIYARVVPD